MSPLTTTRFFGECSTTCTWFTARHIRDHGESRGHGGGRACGSPCRVRDGTLWQCPRRFMKAAQSRQSHARVAAISSRVPIERSRSRAPTCTEIWTTRPVIVSRSRASTRLRGVRPRVSPRRKACGSLAAPGSAYSAAAVPGMSAGCSARAPRSSSGWTQSVHMRFPARDHALAASVLYST